MATRRGTGAHLTILVLMRSTIVLVGAVFALLAPVTASAHGPQAVGRPLTIVQDVGPYELAVTGNYELAVVVSGQNGTGEARVPLTVAPQPVCWLVLVMVIALGVFALIVVGALALQLTWYRRRPALWTRLRGLLAPAMALCAAVALIAFVVTQFAPRERGNGERSRIEPSLRECRLAHHFACGD